jgi:hypothetical protein
MNDQQLYPAAASYPRQLAPTTAMLLRSTVDGVPSADSFDVQDAATLYWKPVPTVLRMPDREEQVVELMVRILSGVSRANHNSRVRRRTQGLNSAQVRQPAVETCSSVLSVTQTL